MAIGGKDNAGMTARPDGEGRLRCLFVSAPFGGIEVYFRTLQSALAERADLDATWMYIGWSLDDWVGNLPIVSRIWTLRASLVCRSRIHALTKAGRRFDVAVFNSIVPMFMVRRALRGIPTVLNIDVTPIVLDSYAKWYSQEHGLVTRLVRWFGNSLRHAQRTYRASSGIIAWSPLVKRSLISDYGVAGEKITIVSPGLDLKRWTGNTSHSHSGTSWKGDRAQILFVGKDFCRKRGDLLVGIAALPDFAGCDFHFVTAWKAAEDLPPNVHIHNDVVPNSGQLMELYARADVFVLPTRADFYPTYACCEAMAMGLPLIITKVGGLDDLIDSEDGGFIIPPDDPAALADRLKILVSGHALRRRMGERNREYARQHFDLESKVGALIKALYKAAGRDPAVCSEPCGPGKA